MSLQAEEEEYNQPSMSPVRLDENGRPTFSRQDAIRSRPVEPLGVIPDNKTVVFFDNDVKNIINMTRPNMIEKYIRSSPIKAKIKGVLINETDRSSFFGLKYPNEIDYSELPVWKDNTYAKMVRVLGGEHLYNSGYPPDKGVIQGHLEMLREWLRTDPEKKTIIFDWDRTLAVTEGFSFPKGNTTYEDNGIKIEDLLEYIMGGADRLSMLREFFEYCNDLNVNILVITNNGAANGRNRHLFLSLIQQVIPQMDDSRLLASRNTNGDKFKSYTRYLQSHPTPSLGGTRRIRQKKRKTRRRGTLRFGGTRRRRR